MPEKAQSSPLPKTGVARFVEEMLARIRKDFYPAPRWGEKRFYQDRQTLIEAITWPAKWMNDRGSTAPASVYRGILWKVIDGIRHHGNHTKVRRFSLYFFKAVQEHMNHHGDQYYYAAKVRPVSAILPAVTRDVGHRCAEDPTTAIMSQINAVLRSRPGGRRRRRDSVGQPDLLPASSFSKVEAPIRSLGKKDICYR